MAINVSAKGSAPDFKPCPDGGQRLVCCDVVDHGMVAGKFGTARKGTIHWQSEHLIDDATNDWHGKPYIVQRRFTLSLHVKAELRKYLESWRGKPFTDAEAEDFDLEKLIGVPAFGQVMHVAKPRGTFAEVVTIMPLPKGMERIVVAPDYVRHKDRVPPPADKTDPADIPNF